MKLEYKNLIILLSISIITVTIASGRVSVQDDIILTWSSSSFVPPGYPGKALPTLGSQITVSASPELLIQGTNFKPQDLIYNWFLDYKLQESASGRGQQDFSFNTWGNKGTVINVKVEIQTPNDILLGLKTLKITLTEPIVQLHHLFENQFIGPVFKNRVDFEPGQKINFIAIPYFFNIKKENQLNYQWYANNNPISIDYNKRQDIAHLEINPEMPLGTIYDIQVRVKNNLKERETASSFLRINVKY